MVLDFPSQWKAFAATLAGLSGEEICIEVYPKRERKSRAQEKGFHAMLRPWAAEGHQVDDLKRFLLREVFGEREVVNPVTGEVGHELREPHTSTLTMAQYSELIERTLEVAAGCGVVLKSPDEYRRQQELKRKAAERKVEAAEQSLITFRRDGMVCREIRRRGTPNPWVSTHETPSRQSYRGTRWKTSRNVTETGNDSTAPGTSEQAPVNDPPAPSQQGDGSAAETEDESC